MEPTRLHTFRLTEADRQLLVALAQWYGVTHTAVLKIALRVLAQHVGITLPPERIDP